MVLKSRLPLCMRCGSANCDGSCPRIDAAKRAGVKASVKKL